MGREPTNFFIKKTIIECLKYACTGELPPNCKNGQAFIHDTKVAGEREVKAQIKLRLITVDKLPFVVTRSMALIQKPAKQECKTLDSSIQSVNPVTKEVT